jgi:hypothetical protein
VKPIVRANHNDQVTSLIRRELVVESVRALSELLAKRIGEMNHELARTAMNGMQRCTRGPVSSDLFLS